MPTREQPLKMNVRGDALTLDFGGNSVVKVDLSSVKMNDKQRATLAKLARAKPGFTFDELPDDQWPAAQRLTSNEFKQIHHLKVMLSTAGELRAIICRFCLKCIRVPDL